MSQFLSQVAIAWLGVMLLELAVLYHYAWQKGLYPKPGAPSHATCGVWCYDLFLEAGVRELLNAPVNAFIFALLAFIFRMNWRSGITHSECRFYVHSFRACFSGRRLIHILPQVISKVALVENEGEVVMSMIGCFVAINDATASQICSAPEQIEKFLYPDDGNSMPENYLEIDKAWHGIHYLLTGSAEEGPEPLTGAVFLGGDEIGEDLGYGPARLLRAEHVHLIAGALPEEKVLSQSYNAKAMEKAEIYPDIWVEEGEEALEYLLGYYKELRKFYQAAAMRGDRVIQWIS